MSLNWLPSAVIATRVGSIQYVFKAIDRSNATTNSNFAGVEKTMAILFWLMTPFWSEWLVHHLLEITHHCASISIHANLIQPNFPVGFLVMIYIFDFEVI